jgi:hypothetical protein
LQQVPPQQTQEFLRDAFTRWGRPQWLRVDNGTPWGATGGLPTALELWLSGVPVGVLHNRACVPQDNGVIEQGHGTSKRWSEPWLCANVAQLQEHVDEVERRQRESYPYRRGQSRMKTFPGLAHSGRQYSRQWEEANWSLEAAEQRLAAVVEARRVDQTGCVSLYSRNVYVGRSWPATTVWVRYDPQGHRWMFHDNAGHLLNHQNAPEISRDSILNLTASDGRSKRRRRT